ncbi:MAG: ABC transporter permease [Prevotella sp.]|nr:ABC transporter permease [Prevotella sp.]
MTIIKDMIGNLTHGFRNMCDVWAEEMRRIFHDEGMILFFIVLPLSYPILYSWVYNNEVVRDVPVAVVDDSRSQLSREFIRLCDGTADVEIVGYAADMDEARRMVGEQKVRGIYHIPSDFAIRVNRGEQSPIAVYTDMSLMLNYKAIFQTATSVSTAMNSKIQIKLAGNYTDREDEITTAPLAFHEIAIFNPTGGYGNFILPAVLILILQQVLILGVGLMAGTARENGHYAEYRNMKARGIGTLGTLTGKSLCYFMLFAVICLYLTVIVPRLFSFVSLAQPMDLLAVMLPFVLACIFFAITVSVAVHYRENVLLIVVFTSVPMLFLSGVSWPQSNIPWFWQSISWLIPSTFGIRSFVRMNTMGATLVDCMTECRALWAQVAFYFVTAYIVIKFRQKEYNEK